MERLVQRITATLTAESSLNQDQQEVVQYSLVFIFNTVISTVGILAVGWAVGAFWEAAVAGGFGALLRSLSGGAHYGTPGRCAAMTTLIFPALGLMSVLLSGLATPALPLAGLLIAVGLPVTLRYAPDVSPKKPIVPSKIGAYRHLSVVLVALAAVVVSQVVFVLPGSIVWALFLGAGWQLLTITPIGHVITSRADDLVKTATKWGWTRT